MVDEFNSKAVDEILGPQNINCGSIDLHGLYEREAIDVVKDFILDNPARRVDVITGKGLHSEPGKGPVLQLAIQKLIDLKGWEYRYNDGCFYIDSPTPDKLIEEDKHEGLLVGDILPGETWASLRDSKDVAFKFSRVGKGIYPYAVILIDPRRSSDQSKVAIDQFKQLSCAKLGLSLAVVTWDDPSDLQKLVKKKKIDWCMLLSDSQKNVCENRFMLI